MKEETQGPSVQFGEMFTCSTSPSVVLEILFVGDRCGGSGDILVSHQGIVDCSGLAAHVRWCVMVPKQNLLIKETHIMES